MKILLTMATGLSLVFSSVTAQAHSCSKEQIKRGCWVERNAYGAPQCYCPPEGFDEFNSASSLSPEIFINFSGQTATSTSNSRLTECKPNQEWQEHFQCLSAADNLSIPIYGYASISVERARETAIKTCEATGATNCHISACWSVEFRNPVK
jgi:hypothetical protein